MRESLIIENAIFLREQEEILTVKIPKKKDLVCADILEKISVVVEIPGEDFHQSLIRISNYMRSPIIQTNLTNEEDILLFTKKIEHISTIASHFFTSNRLLVENIRPIITDIKKCVCYYIEDGGKLVRFFHILKKVGEHNNTETFITDYGRITEEEKMSFIKDLSSFIREELTELLLEKTKPE